MRWAAPQPREGWSWERGVWAGSIVMGGDPERRGVGEVRGCFGEGREPWREGNRWRKVPNFGSHGRVGVCMKGEN